ncbi:MAG: cytidine deaminase [Patescibacteria group bacterium]
MPDELSYLKDGLLLAVAKKALVGGGNRSSSVCYSKSGQKYRGANVDSDTHLLNISSEQVALLLAVSREDYLVEEIVTMVEKNDGFVLNPLVVKILVDFCARVGREIKYRIININGDIVFESETVTKLISFYTPVPNLLSKTINAKPGESHSAFIEGAPISEELKKYALIGLSKCFTTHDSASGYGASAITEDGTIYHAGQYSSFEKRSNIHAEMAAMILALMDGKTKITALGIVSTKYADTPCEICGCCRQFLAEISSRYGLSMKFYCFAKDNEKFKEYTLDALLPNQWSSKKL